MKSVSVCVPSTTEIINKLSFRKNNNNLPSTATGSLILPTVSNPSQKGISEREKWESPANMPSFSSLLRELNELEQSVKEWGRNDIYPSSPPSFSPSDKSKERIGAAGRLEESIVVVKESDDPFDDFKKSMLQMIVENEIEGKDEMEELLQRFLLLNSLENHSVIVRAFTELWEDVFCEVEETTWMDETFCGTLIRHLH
jgi:uncharacterized protein (TIGR01568 family)